MRYLLILDAALFALALTLSMVLGVVAILYGANAELSARVSAELPLVVRLSVWFAVIAVPLGLAFWSLKRRQSWHWWVQAAAALTLGLGSLTIYRLLS